MIFIFNLAAWHIWSSIAIHRIRCSPKGAFFSCVDLLLVSSFGDLSKIFLPTANADLGPCAPHPSMKYQILPWPYLPKTRPTEYSAPALKVTPSSPKPFAPSAKLTVTGFASLCTQEKYEICLWWQAHHLQADTAPLPFCSGSRRIKIIGFPGDPDKVTPSNLKNPKISKIYRNTRHQLGVHSHQHQIKLNQCFCIECNLSSSSVYRIMLDTRFRGYPSRFFECLNYLRMMVLEIQCP